MALVPVQGQKKTERANPPFLCLFVLFRPLTDGMRLTHTGSTICLFGLLGQMLISFRSTLKTYPEVMFNKVSRHTMTRSRWHKINPHRGLLIKILSSEIKVKTLTGILEFKSCSHLHPFPCDIIMMDRGGELCWIMLWWSQNHHGNPGFAYIFRRGK